MTSYEEYKEAKEAFVSQLQGGSVLKINAVSLTALTTFTLWAILRNCGLIGAADDGRYSKRRRRGTSDHSNKQSSETYFHSDFLRSWLVEFVVLILPIVLACTIFAERLLALNGIIISLSAITLLLHPNALILINPLHEIKGKNVKKKHWSKESDDEEDEDEERERDRSAESETALRPVSISNEPFRVSIDSAAEAANASAAPPTRYEAPGSSDLSHSSPLSQPSTPISKVIKHRSSPSLARSAASLPGVEDDDMAVQTSSHQGQKAKVNRYVPRNQPFLTVYRAHMMLMTIICILAVDFKAFPREFAKCESWGTSLMDLGVGSFVFSLGIISASPMLRLPSQRFKPMRFQLLRDARKSLPLILLGGIRVIMVKGVDYPEHVSEYGVHWNFFITLALLPFFGTLCRPFARLARFSTIGLLISCVHQSALSMTTLGNWAISNSIRRTDLIVQNKEGLTSLPGYFAIFLLGLDLGHYILPRDPYFAYRRLTASRQKEKTDKLVLLLISYSILWWAAYYSFKLVFGGLVSRRLANLPYVLWVVAYNTSFLLAYVTVYMIFLQPLDEDVLRKTKNAEIKGKAAVRGTESTPNGVYSTIYSREDDEDDGMSKTPMLFNSLNANAFAVFLIANLLTGLVNLSMKTMYASDTVALLALLSYLTFCLAMASFVQIQGWRIKI